ncbi:lipopolysaccharide biosynthesis protein [Bordetella pertussis]|uniref:Lipopolysaccharide biosynthesis protein n=12 Tax=Bordetella TaxID=517 RepID=Q7W0M2_BORPE|nr:MULTISPECIES: O-antigen biosynthesis protein WlbI [Bordetella]ABF72489.1 BplI [Bordetella parapertussis]ETH40599.1 PF10997 family protein [Bordetella pertussis H918]ETH43967.1 PF10997 family protein [Bordetella pertussis H939]ETH48683.1 PF10997 family protein [Bordetella pertussis H921]ETH73102.1 PF10997 family protein [Bordetella pertussis STO1-CHLA-0011]ETH82072.1 PF10997 family protein [Bordetella pertussis STO1-CHOC-0017]ETH88854.1 PF10997 family protein [Bordetella pertussis STO1-CHO
MMTLLPLLVIASYSIIHLLEYLSYYARVAGRMAGKPVTGYAIQNATTTVTRFFYLALMPLLGFLVDKQVPTSLYLQMGLAAMFGAALLSLLGYWLRYSWIALLTNAVRKRAGQPPLRVEEIRTALEAPASLPKKRIALLAAIVFLCYCLGVLLSYFFALVFHEYRSTISQLSGLINGVATVLLTFVLEPRIAGIVDARPTHDVYHAIQAMLNGRLIAIGLLAPALFFGVCIGFV